MIDFVRSRVEPQIFSSVQVLGGDDELTPEMNETCVSYDDIFVVIPRIQRAECSRTATFDFCSRSNNHILAKGEN